MNMRNLIVRTLVTLLVLGLMSRIVYFLFTKPVDKQVETILNVVMGGLLVSLHKIIDYWFHRRSDKDDGTEDPTPEQ